MREVASASCRRLSCTRSASELDVRGIPSTIERLRSGLEPFAERLSRRRGARHSPFIYDELVPNFKIPHRVRGSGACAIHPKREWQAALGAEEVQTLNAQREAPNGQRDWGGASWRDCVGGSCEHVALRNDRHR